MLFRPVGEGDDDAGDVGDREDEDGQRVRVRGSVPEHEVVVRGEAVERAFQTEDDPGEGRCVEGEVPDHEAWADELRDDGQESAAVHRGPREMRGVGVSRAGA